MKTLELKLATKPFAIYARKARREPVIVTRRGKPLAALIGLPNADFETVSLSNNPEFLELIERSRSKVKKSNGISSSVMRNRLKLQKSKDRLGARSRRVIA